MRRKALRPPFGMGSVQPAFDRATRIAKALFGALDASVVLIDGDRLWRSRDFEGFSGEDPAADIVIASGEPLWIEDSCQDPRVCDSAMVEGGPHLRFYAGAPVQLSDGSTPGVLCVVGDAPRPFDGRLLNRLRDLAEGVADVCERAKATQVAASANGELETAKTVLAVLGATIPVTLVMTDRETRVIYGSPRWLSSWGLTEATAIGRTLDDIGPDYYPQFKSAFSACLGGRTIRNPRLRSERNGQVNWLQTELAPWRDAGGEVGGLIIVANFITELVEAEDALIRAKEESEAANHAKSDFLATMSHEIRTPLNGVLGMAQAMAVDDLAQVQRERLDVIRQSGEALLAILNDVLDLSKIEAGKLELEDAEFDVADLARGAHASFTVIANAKGLGFELVIEDSAQGVYRGDPTRVRQILYNLISNALKFTEAGEVRVAVRRVDDGLSIVVRDTGIGMDPETASSVFSSFVQADASTTRRFGGTGLGLSICREIAALMGGGVEVASELGAGSTFTARLPLPWLRPSADGTLGPGALRTAAPEPRNAPIRLLAAEDNPMNRFVLETLLNQAGVDPTVVENGADCVAAWESGAWDLILMDVQMPVMDGLSATRAIREREAKTGRQRTPIVALTANAMAHQVAEYRAAGMDGHVSKPIEAAKLFEAVEAALAQSERSAREYVAAGDLAVRA